MNIADFNSSSKSFFVSERMTTPPATFSTALQRQIYEALEKLGIPFERVDTDPGITMEDCQNINAGIGGRIVKSIFLCNRQQTHFYIYVTRDDKPFVTKDFGQALSIPRVSFAPADKLWEIAGTERGATTILSACLQSAKEVTLVVDQEVINGEYYCCTDGTATCFIKLKTSDLLEKFIPACGQHVVII